MDRRPAPLYGAYPSDAAEIIGQHLASGLAARRDSSPVTVFFRADDIGVPSAAFSRMIALFQEKQAPLCLAVVPAWLTQNRWTAIGEICDREAPLWCWHQHGWAHRNHQKTGKKSEFGTARPGARIRADLSRGKERLQNIMGAAFSAYFTPPWNRCCPEALKALKDLDFRGLSRSRDSQPQSRTLQEMMINVDLHTRKEPDSAGCLAGLAAEIEQAARSGSIGIMLHHQRMNEQAFVLLDELLDMVVLQPLVKPVTFKDLFPSD